VLWLGTLLPLRQSVAELRDDVGRLEAAARSGGGANGSIAGQASALIRKLPTRTELPGVLTAVVSQATAAGLELGRGDYEFMLAKSGRIHRYRLAFPVRGTYPQVRKFVDGTLAALPAVALEGLKLERDDIGDPQLEADLRFAVMVRSE
jgi:Tfp pilus assembly protein PilO